MFNSISDSYECISFGKIGLKTDNPEYFRVYNNLCEYLDDTL